MLITVLQRVLQREHVLDGQKFSVSLYYKELGLFPPGVDGSSQFEAVPSDIAVDCAPEIAAFILHNPPLKQKVICSVSVEQYFWQLWICETTYHIDGASVSYTHLTLPTIYSV